MIQLLKVCAFDHAVHAGLPIDEAVDWDVPSAGSTFNSGGFSAPERLIHLRGTDYDCQDDTRRFAGQSLIGMGSPIDGIDTLMSPFGAMTSSNSLYLYEHVGFDPEQAYTLMQQPGYSALPGPEDQFSFMIFVNTHTLSGSDTLLVYSGSMTIRNGTLDDLKATSVKAKRWAVNHLFTPVVTYLPGDANGDKAIDISDAVFLIAYIFTGGSAPAPEAAGDANCDNGVDISDAVYLIAFIFGGGPAPCERH